MLSAKRPLDKIVDAMQKHGAQRIFFKLLANNDNSKNQIYFGGDFDFLRIIPHGELKSQFNSKDGTVFKAQVSLYWLNQHDLNSPPVLAEGTQLIYYPRYPEVRLSGFLRGCIAAPSHLMQPPTAEQRALYENAQRCLILGVCSKDRVLAFAGAWQSDYSKDALDRIEKGLVSNVATVFYEIVGGTVSSKDALLKRLYEVYCKGEMPSSRLDKNGVRKSYEAQNGAGYTLEAEFGITPNGYSIPDYQDWELKAHSKGAISLMTPEPDTGIYVEDTGRFLSLYGRTSPDCTRMDFTGRHFVNTKCKGTQLRLLMQGFDPEPDVGNFISDPLGGLILIDENDNIVAGWSFRKLLDHWSRKHEHTAYVFYTKNKSNNSYSYGPDILLCEGAEVKTFLNALYEKIIYYDPGVNQKLNGNKWTVKKRNQFRVKWKDIEKLYKSTKALNLEILKK